MYTHRGAYLNAIGEVVEHGLVVSLRLSLDAAHVSLQRLVLSLGGHGGRRRQICLPEVNAERAVKLIERGRRHPSLRRAHRSPHA